MSVFLIILSITVLLLGFLFPSKKSVTILLLAYMWLMFAFNTENGDYLNYVGIYTRIGKGYVWTISHYEDGYVAICKLCSSVFNLGYPDFIILIATVSTILFGIVIKLWTNFQNQNQVISLFVIVLYWMMICQYRYYIGFLLVLIGLYFLINKEGAWSYILFGIYVLLGTSMHSSIALFALLIIFKKVKVKHIAFFVPILIIFLFMIRLGFMGTFINLFVPEYKMDRWIYSEGTRSTLGIVLLLLTRVFLVALEFCIVNSEEKSVLDESYVNNIKNIYKVTMICSAFFALEIINKNYERLFRLPLFLSFILFSEYFDKHKVKLRKVPIQTIMSFLYVILYMISFYLSFEGWFKHNLIPILTYNSLIRN